MCSAHFFITILQNDKCYEDKFLIHKLFHGEARNNAERNLVMLCMIEKFSVFQIVPISFKRQGKRTDLTSVPVAQKLQGKTSREILAEQVGESQDQIRRYIRLTELIPPLLDMVDEGKIAMRPAVELSYLPKKQQEVLFDTIEMEDCTPSHAQAIKMRKFSDEKRLNEDVILSIMSEEKGNQKEQFTSRKRK